MGKKLKDLLTVDKIFILQESGVYLQDVVALFYDLKPLLRTGISHWKFEAFKKTLLELGFKLLTMEQRGPNKENFNCIISKSEKKLKEYYKVENIKMGRLDDLFGKLFGYPHCCIEKFMKNASMNKSLPPITFSNTKGRLDFRLNYLYSFDSRQFNNYEEFNSVTKGYLLSNNYLIPYLPCSFNCKESISYTQKLLDILKSEFPEYYKRLTSFLKKPILFFSDFVFFPLSGKIEGDTFRYKDFINIHEHLPTKIVESLNKGNLIKRESDRLKIYKGRRCIDKLPSSVKLFNFE